MTQAPFDRVHLATIRSCFAICAIEKRVSRGDPDSTLYSYPGWHCDSISASMDFTNTSRHEIESAPGVRLTGLAGNATKLRSDHLCNGIKAAGCTATTLPLGPKHETRSNEQTTFTCVSIGRLPSVTGLASWRLASRAPIAPQALVETSCGFSSSMFADSSF